MGHSPSVNKVQSPTVATLHALVVGTVPRGRGARLVCLPQTYVPSRAPLSSGTAYLRHTYVYHNTRVPLPQTYVVDIVARPDYSFRHKSE